MSIAYYMLKVSLSYTFMQNMISYQHSKYILIRIREGRMRYLGVMMVSIMMSGLYANNTPPTPTQPAPALPQPSRQPKGQQSPVVITLQVTFMAGMAAAAKARMKQ